MTALQDKYQSLLDNIRQHESAVLAFSGGVDSSFLLAAVIDSGIRYVAVTAVSPTMPTHDREMVQELARELGANHQMITSGEMDDANFVENPDNRCFYCKSDLFGRLTRYAEEQGFAVVLDGSTADDLGDYRPGMEAKKRFQVASPLMESGMGKAEVRLLSKEKNLKTWDKPASPCLSSRIPYGEKITLVSLGMVDKAEIRLRQLGFQEFRVRKQGETARIELPPADLHRMLDPAVREQVVPYFRQLGFLYVTLDLEGFQSGKLNRMVG